MAITAFRPDGASHFNRFLGTVVRAAGLPTPSGEVPAAGVIPGTVAVQFGPLDIPQTVLDDNGWPFGTPQAGFPPHADPDLQTWAQNTKVICKALDANITDAVISAQTWSLDPATNLPILSLDITFAALPADIDVWVEITHSKVR